MAKQRSLAGKKKASASSTRATARKTAPQKKGFLRKIDSFWNRESNVIAWAAAIVILLLFINVAVLKIRVLNADDQAAIRTPKANDSIAIMKFQWEDNIEVHAKMYQPLKGSKIVLIDTQILNLSPNNLWLAPSVESYIRDANNVHYGLALAEVNRPFAAGSYAPQQVASGELTYAIPQTIKHPQWCYQLATSSGGGLPLCFPLNAFAEIHK